MGPWASQEGRERQTDTVRGQSCSPNQQWRPEQVFQLFCACFISNKVGKKYQPAHLQICGTFTLQLSLERLLCARWREAQMTPARVLKAM